jgi:hypothetical protein
MWADIDRCASTVYLRSIKGDWIYIVNQSNHVHSHHTYSTSHVAAVLSAFTTRMHGWVDACLIGARNLTSSSSDYTTTIYLSIVSLGDHDERHR